MLHYIVQTVAFQLFFLLIYDVFLKKETFFNWNRMYLIVTSLLSIAIPFIKINRFKDVLPQEYIISLPEVVIGQSASNTNNTVLLETVVIDNSVSYWVIAFYIGIAIALSVFLYKLIRILVLIFKNPKTYQKDLTLVKLINSNAAFSFFRYVFLGDFIKSEEREAILKHETVHVKHLHSLDLLFFEILRILFWFNPLVYMYQNRINTLHEFIADAEAVKHQDKSQYYQNLLAQVFETKNISFINTFFKQSLIKKRIVMLTKSKSKQIHLFKYGLLIPLVFGMLVYTSCASYKNKVEKKELPLVEQINQLKNAIEAKEEITLEEEKQAMIGLSKTLDKTKYANLEDVPFSEIDQAPVFPGCEDLNTIDQKRCLSENINKYVNRNFNTNLATELGLVGRQRINVIFKIDKEGNVVNIRTRAPHPALEEEALRVLKIMPKMIPGRQGGRKVNVLYSLPIIFQVADEYTENIDVPFSVIEQVPVFPGCEDLTSNEERRDCMSEKISKLVQEKFNTNIADSLGLTGRQRINVIFKINEKGGITTDEIRARAPHIDLEEEAIRVISTLPKMIPGKQKGKIVNVPYSLPIIFQVQDDVKNKELETIPLNEVLIDENIDIPFTVVEKAPIFPGCENMSNSEQRKCTSNEVSKHFNKYFNTKIAKDNGLTGRQRINVIFKIDKEGNVIDVRSRAPHPSLEEEAIRVIKTLPKMIPGEQKGKKVNVPYSLPIIFQVAD
ncbi:energy transducer TonB [Thalassobellus suaedae]|uniref:M56 family metallopeptidase n=1 Tax=Thalassobellus suaedae TaxID=3074124 RepID=A0ABY9Y6X1_9FLAO|nr:M56 family metallopeptidase [Flavobacteriaceae bacterium HL-DH10]